MAAKKTTEASTELATASYPVNVDDFAEFAGSGFENQTSDDYAIPFISVLQGLSPILESRDDLKAGMLFNTVTGTGYVGKEGIAFVPATTIHNFIEYRPRNGGSGGGFVAAHPTTSPMVQAAVASSETYGKYQTPDGNDLIETFSVYGTVIEADGTTTDAVISFTSTKIKRYKAWMTKAKTIQMQAGDGRRFPAPLFAHRYRLKTVSEKNAKGSFYNLEITFDGASAVEARLSTQDPIFQAAVAIKGLIESGVAHADYASADKVGGAGGEGDDGAGAGGTPVF